MVTESTAVPMWVVWRPGQTVWMRMFVAPFSADVGCGPVAGVAVVSLADRTVVQAVGPGVSSRPSLSARRKCEPAHCCQAAGGQPNCAHAARPLAEATPCCVPATEMTSVTLRLKVGQ